MNPIGFISSNVGGTPAVMKYLLEKGFIKGDCMTVTGRTIAENLQDLPALKDGQDVFMPLEKPIKQTGHIQILKGKSSSWIKKKTNKFPVGTLWARGYFVTTTGLNEHAVSNYIKNQSHHQFELVQQRLPWFTR